MRWFLSYVVTASWMMGACSGKPPGTEGASGVHPVDLPPPPMLVTVDAAVDAIVDTQTNPEPSGATSMNPPTKTKPDALETVQAYLKKLQPVRLTYPEDELKPEWIPLIGRLVEAARVMDTLFLLQVSPENPAIREEILHLVERDETKAPLLEYFDRMFGPWNRLDNNQPFWGKAKKPLGAGFYDLAITRKNFTAHLLQLKTGLTTEKDPRRLKQIQNEYDALTSLYTFVSLKDGVFTHTWYHDRFRMQLQQVQNSLLAAAELSTEPTLTRYLRLRARDLLEDRYQESDFAWLDVRGPIEFLIGPYEVYEDELMGYKASYEAFVNLVDFEYSKKLETIRAFRYELDAALPYHNKFRSARGMNIPIVVVNQLFSAGETKAGVQTMAFNLPNDEEVRRTKGFKLVLFRNVAQAKFEAVLLPIAKLVINPAQVDQVTFDAFFTHTLYHEVMHGLGPSFLRIDGKNIEIRQLLKETYATNEEAKADVGALVGMESLVRTRKVLTEEQRQAQYVTFVASIFRSIRFGAGEAHAKANLMALSWFIEQKAVQLDPVSLTATVDIERMPEACRSFVAEILNIQTTGNPSAALDFEQKYAVIPALVNKMLAKLNVVPVDITPIYPILEKLN